MQNKGRYQIDVFLFLSFTQWGGDEHHILRVPALSEKALDEAICFISNQKKIHLNCGVGIEWFRARVVEE